MHQQVLDPIGVRVTGAPLDKCDPALAEDIRGLLAEHGVVVFDGQNIDTPTFLAFLQSFGELMFTAGETPVPDFPDLNVISNVGRTTAPRSTFHVDTTYVSHPPAYTALRAVRVPAVGGHTLFSNQYAAYDSLPSDLRNDLEGRLMTHVVTGVDPGAGAETCAEHPIFLTHPLSRRVALYLTAPARCRAISGKSATETARIVHLLVAHSTAPGNVLTHTWSGGDVVMWDNRVVMHRADHSGVIGDRVMYRGMVR